MESNLLLKITVWELSSLHVNEVSFCTYNYIIFSTQLNQNLDYFYSWHLILVIVYAASTYSYHCHFCLCAMVGTRLQAFCSKKALLITIKDFQTKNNKLPLQIKHCRLIYNVFIFFSLTRRHYYFILLFLDHK